MGDTTAIFFDVGGVLLTNAWDHSERRRVIDHFALNREDFEARHERVVDDFERGRMGLSEYMRQTVFYQPRQFTPETFRDMMFAQSQAYPEALSFLGELALSGRYLLGTLNNESKELNEYRIGHFGLRAYFTVFFSSCFLGVRKPDEKIYRLALDISQRPADGCLFVDDRPANVESARAVGMRTVLYKGVASLRDALK